LPWGGCVKIENFFLYMVDTEKHILLFNPFSDSLKRFIFEKNLHLVPRLRKHGAIPPIPICFHDMHRDNFTFAFKLCAVRDV
jgi:hypothetical protein